LQGLNLLSFWDSPITVMLRLELSTAGRETWNRTKTFCASNRRATPCTLSLEMDAEPRVELGMSSL
jgi:hypothetical protein